MHIFQLAADPDPNVKNGAELLDRLVKVLPFVNFIVCVIYTLNKLYYFEEQAYYNKY